MSVIPNPHPEHEWPDPPSGYHIEWTETPDRRVVTDEERGRPCRGSRRCPGQVVMALKRSTGWWFYCDQHMYGSRLRDGVIVSRRVVRDEDT